MLIRDDESEIIDHRALSVTNRERENKRQGKEIKETKYSVVMPVDSVANYKSLARRLWLYSNTLLLWWSDFQQPFPLTTQLRPWDCTFQSFDYVRATFFAGDVQLSPGKFIELILCVHLRLLI